MNPRLRRAALCLSLIAGCSAADGFPMAASDSGVSRGDGGASQDASPPAGEAEFDSARANPGACFDGLDNNDDGLADCADTSCRSNVASCCVGSADASCCPDAETTGLPIGVCAGEFGGCALASDYTVFGSRGPEVVSTGPEPAWIPNGGDGEDGGAVHLETLDPRRGTLSLTGLVAAGSDDGVDAIESIGFGLIDAGRDPARLTRVEPLVGVVVSRNRQRVILQVAGEAVAEDALSSTGPTSYTLLVSPDGAVALTTGTGARLEARVTLAGPTRLIVWGRTPADVIDPPRLTRLDVRQSACDMPAALTPGPIVVPAPTDPDPTWQVERVRLERPHVLRFLDGGVTREWMVLRADGAIHVAEPGQGGYVDAFGAPVLAPVTDGWGEDGVDSPRLRRVDGQLELWFTGYDAAGRGTIAVAKWDESQSRFDNPVPIDGLSADGVTSYEAAAPYDVDGRRLAAVRVRDADGERLTVFEVPDGSPAYALEIVRAPRPSDVGAFDRDAVDSPAVIVAGGVYRLYFAGRRGNRWSLGVLVSDDGVYWRAPTEGPIAAPSANGFDALARRDPAPVAVDGALRLYYAGSDGVRTRIGVLDGRLPE